MKKFIFTLLLSSIFSIKSTFFEDIFKDLNTRIHTLEKEMCDLQEDMAREFKQEIKLPAINITDKKQSLIINIKNVIFDKTDISYNEKGLNANIATDEGKIKLTIEDNQLTAFMENKTAVKEENKKTKSAMKSINQSKIIRFIPEDLNFEKIEAVYQKKELIITIPKKIQSFKKITIQKK